MIAVVDYHKGNLKSVERGLWAVGADARITDDPRAIARADAVVLPGVGAFGDAVASLKSLGQFELLKELLAQGRPFLGICLGLHLLFEGGLEGAAEDKPIEGLGLLPGIVTKMPAVDEKGVRYKIPHVGWNSVEPLSEQRLDLSDPWGGCPLLASIEPGEHLYFTHSYIAPPNPATVAITTHSVSFPSVVAVGDAVFGVQFHPEKSSDVGSTILENFLTVAERSARAPASRHRHP